MTITVETGAIVLNATSYISIADCDTYHDDRGRAVTWTAITNALKEEALIRANQGIEDMYRNRWIGFKTNNNITVVPIQLLAWPRKLESDTDSTTALDDTDGIEIGINTVPAQVANAVAEAAFIELSSRINPSTLDHNEQRIKVDKIGPLTTEYFDTPPTLASYPILDRMLTGLATPAAGGLSFAIGLTADELTRVNNPEWWLDSDYFIQG